MKKICFIVVLICFLLPGSHCFVEAVELRFKTLRAPSDWEFYGTPLKVIKIESTGKAILKVAAINYSYVYRITVLRPGKDDGRGVVYDGLYYKLHYWVAEEQLSGIVSAVLGGYNVRQMMHPDNPRYIILEIALSPGIHNLEIAIFPYLMYSSTGDFKEVMEFGRSDYLSFVQNLFDKWKFGDAILKTIKDKPKDIAIDLALIYLSKNFGQLVQFEVPATMPKITTRYAQDASDVLKLCSLVPNPDYTHTIPTDDRRYDNRVALQQYPVNEKLKAGSPVAYKFYKYITDNSQMINPAGSTDFWLGNWDLTSLHTANNHIKGASVRSRLIITKKNGKYSAKFANNPVKDLIVTETGLSYSVDAGGNHVNVKLKIADQDTINGGFKGYIVKSKIGIEGNYTGKRAN